MSTSDHDAYSRLEYTSTGTGTRTRASTVTSMARTTRGTAARRDGVRVLVTGGRALAAAAGWLGETVTPIGWLLAASAVAGIAAGAVLGWSVGWMIGVASLVLLLTAIPFLAGGYSYRVQFRVDRDAVVAGSDVTGTVQVVNAARRTALPGLVDIPVGDGLVETRVPFLRPQATHEETIAIRAAKRGVIDVGPMSVSRGDPVGALRREVVWPQIQTIHVHPVTAYIPSTGSGLLHDLEGLPSSNIVNADLAFHAIRDYVPGDARNHVHWKSTAKTGKLMVRQYEETRQSRIAVLIGTEAEGEYSSDDEFELGVSAAASLSLQAVRDGRELIVTTGAQQPELSRGDVIAVREIPTHGIRPMLDGFSEIDRAVRMTRLEDVARLVSQTADRLSLVFLVSGSVMPVQRLRTAGSFFDAESTVVIVRCEPGADPVMRRVGDVRVLTLGRLEDLGQLIARGALE